MDAEQVFNVILIFHKLHQVNIFSNECKNITVRAQFVYNKITVNIIFRMMSDYKIFALQKLENTK